MKTFIALSILFAFVFTCQAENYVMKARFTHEESNTVSGRITGELISEKQTTKFDLGSDSNIFKIQTAFYSFNSTSPIDSIKITWETKDGFSLGLNPIFIALSDYGYEKFTLAYVPEKKEIANGETVIYHKY